MTEHEKAIIEQNMQLAGIRNREAYLRKMAIDGYILRLELDDVKQLVYLLRNATNNLNQLTRRANENRSVYAEDIQDLQRSYDRLWEQSSKILRELANVKK